VSPLGHAKLETTKADNRDRAPGTAQRHPAAAQIVSRAQQVVEIMNPNASSLGRRASTFPRVEVGQADQPLASAKIGE
jgi:hypothetical protein